MKTHRPPNLIAAAFVGVQAITSTLIAQAQHGLQGTEEKQKVAGARKAGQKTGQGGVFFL